MFAAVFHPKEPAGSIIETSCEYCLSGIRLEWGERDEWIHVNENLLLRFRCRNQDAAQDIWEARDNHSYDWAAWL